MYYHGKCVFFLRLERINKNSNKLFPIYSIHAGGVFNATRFLRCKVHLANHHQSFHNLTRLQIEATPTLYQQAANKAPNNPNPPSRSEWLLPGVTPTALKWYAVSSIYPPEGGQGWVRGRPRPFTEGPSRFIS